jgi:hypothetical protein
VRSGSRARATHDPEVPYPSDDHETCVAQTPPVPPPDVNKRFALLSLQTAPRRISVPTARRAPDPSLARRPPLAASAASRIEMPTFGNTSGRGQSLESLAGETRTQRVLPSPAGDNASGETQIGGPRRHQLRARKWRRATATPPRRPHVSILYFISRPRFPASHTHPCPPLAPPSPNPLPPNTTAGSPPMALALGAGSPPTHGGQRAGDQRAAEPRAADGPAHRLAHVARPVEYCPPRHPTHLNPRLLISKTASYDVARNVWLALAHG